MFATVGEPFFVYQAGKLDVSAVTGVNILPPARPDAHVTISRADIAPSRVGVGDKVNALDVLYQAAEKVLLLALSL